MKRVPFHVATGDGFTVCRVFPTSPLKRLQILVTLASRAIYGAILRMAPITVFVWIRKPQYSEGLMPRNPYPKRLSRLAPPDEGRSSITVGWWAR